MGGILNSPFPILGELDSGLLEAKDHLAATLCVLTAPRVSSPSPVFFTSCWLCVMLFWLNKILHSATGWGRSTPSVGWQSKGASVFFKMQEEACDTCFLPLHRTLGQQEARIVFYLWSSCL